MRGNPKFLLLFLAALFCLFGVAIWLGAQRNSELRLALAGPNGYDDLLAAGQMLPFVEPDVPEMELRLLIEENAGAFLLARAGLSKECQVPLQFSQEWIHDHLPNLANLKKLAQAFAAEGTIAEADQRWGDAAGSYLDAVRLGNEIRRGGLLIDLLVGIACEAIGLSRIEKIVTELGPEQCRELVQALEKMDREKESFSAISKRERVWADRASGFKGLLAGRILSLKQMLFRTSGDTAAALTETKLNRMAQQNRLLAVRLAARAYELEQATPPENVDQLIPDYLSAIPVDPFTGEKLLLNSSVWLLPRSPAR
jgi:hypothetical protein